MKYPDRDPKLKDNWRGRTRMNNVNQDDVIVYEESSLPDNQEEAPSDEWNYQALRNAMHKGMSFWRSHGNSKCH